MYTCMYVCIQVHFVYEHIDARRIREYVSNTLVMRIFLATSLSTVTNIALELKLSDAGNLVLIVCHVTTKRRSNATAYNNNNHSFISVKWLIGGNRYLDNDTSMPKRRLSLVLRTINETMTCSFAIKN